MRLFSFRSLLSAGFLALSTTASVAVPLKMTATSAAVGELGYFIVDDDLLAVDQILVASQFIDYFFSDPISGRTIDPSDVDGDTGNTFFELKDLVWTVTGGGGDSLTDVDSGLELWLANTYLVWFKGSGTPAYKDVTWNTEEYNPTVVALPAALPLLATGLGVLGFANRRRRTAVSAA